MPRRSEAIALLMFAAVLGAALAAGAQGGDEKAGAKVPVAKFSHEAHRDLGVVGSDNCDDCHGRDAKGALTPPAEDGHQPCLRSGCHAADFLAIGEKTKEETPERWREAAAFCRGCHVEVPRNFDRAKADNVYRLHPNPEHHVELDHFEHTKRTKCRDCHVVHPQLRKPGHPECARCHGDSAPPMSYCAVCHQRGAPDKYFTERREGSRVRSCNTPEHLKRAEKLGRDPDDVPCFSHEHQGHRQWKKGVALQCSHCHFMVSNQKYWKLFKHEYRSLKDLKAAPVMENRGQGNKAHQACGAMPACHRREVRTEGTCKKCHDYEALSIFD